MSLLDKLERKFGRYGVPHVTEGLILGQLLVAVATLGAPQRLDDLRLTAGTLVDGELYRVLTFMFVPPGSLAGSGVLFVFLAWYIFYLFGTSLEQGWGAFRYNLYLLIAWAATAAAAMAMPLVGGTGVMHNYFIGMSVFLAFAYLNPNFEVRLFFVWPVAVKWLAMIAGVFVAGAVVAGPMPDKLAALASVANFLVFFAADIVRRLRGMRRRAVARMEAEQLAEQPFHTCRVCGATDKTDPDLEFRYCDACAGVPCYCERHIFDHEHIAADDATRPRQRESEST